MDAIPNRSTPHSFGDVALHYQARWGLNIIPGFPERKEPVNAGWGHSLHIRAMHGAPIDPYELSQFWEREPLANILMFSGALSGVDVIDVSARICGSGVRLGPLLPTRHRAFLEDADIAVVDLLRCRRRGDARRCERHCAHHGEATQST